MIISIARNIVQSPGGTSTGATWLLLGTVLLATGSPLGPAAWGQSAPQSAPTSQATAPMDLAVNKLIQQLDDDDPVVRGWGSLRVNSLEGSALGLIEAALRSEATSPEAAARLETALKYIRPRAARERERAARVAWESRTLHEAYEKSGRTNPAYDAQALQAIDLFLRLGRDPLRGPAAPRAAAMAAFDLAVDKGCDDPLILCLRMCADGRTEGLMAPQSYQAATGVTDGPYPPAAKLLAVVAYGWDRANVSQIRQIWPSAGSMQPPVGRVLIA